VRGAFRAEQGRHPQTPSAGGLTEAGVAISRSADGTVLGPPSRAACTAPNAPALVEFLGLGDPVPERYGGGT
jgi:hypothetical protein